MLAAAGANAQTVFLETGSALTPGNFGTDLTGATPGQGGWYTTILPETATGFNADFKVVDMGGAYGNAIQITGSNAATGTRILSHDVAAAWSGRTAGNNLAELSFDYFTGPVTTSKNNMRVTMYESATRTKMLGGFLIIVETGEARGLGFYDGTANAGGVVGNYSFTLGGTTTAPAAAILAPNTWYRLGVSYNYTTGEFIFREANDLFNRAIQGAAMGTDITEVDVISSALSTAGATPTVSGIGVFDNILLKASASQTPLAAKSFGAATFAISPNPANNFISMKAANGDVFHAATLTDINGRVVAAQNFSDVDSATMDISKLASGMYLITIDSNNGSITKKIVKN